jgi:cysteine desulfurase/selenocysteine lyase
MEMPVRQCRRYCDQAATSWPKPPEVYAAWQSAATELGVAAGRGGYREAIEAARVIDNARRAWAEQLGGVDPRRIAMPATATLGLNIAIHGLARPGDHVIATAADHNATLRPLAWLAGRGVVELTILPCDRLGRVDPQDVARSWRPATRLLVFSHASNVTGAVQDAEVLAAIARERDGLVILDAAQTVGVVPLAAERVADVLVAPAHKWMLAPHGNACLWCREGVEPETLVQGGTGSFSENLEMPASFSERHEAGTADLAAAAGFVAAVAWRRSQSEAGRSPHQNGQQIAAACRAALGRLEGVRLIADDDGPPIVSFSVEHYAPSEVAATLEMVAGVQARSGFHCAGSVHRWLNTPEGTVRVSFGPFNTDDDCRAIVETVAALAGGTAGVSHSTGSSKSSEVG